MMPDPGILVIIVIAAAAFAGLLYVAGDRRP
jgi:hypothetical protein